MPAPIPFSTSTSAPSLASFETPPGAIATRVSPGYPPLGTNIRMIVQQPTGFHLRQQKTRDRERQAGQTGGAVASAAIIVLGGICLDDAQIFPKHQVPGHKTMNFCRYKAVQLLISRFE